MNYIECILLSVQYSDDYSFDSETGIDNDIDQLRNDSIDLYRLINKNYNQFVIKCLLYYKNIILDESSDWKVVDAYLTLIYNYSDDGKVDKNPEEFYSIISEIINNIHNFTHFEIRFVYYQILSKYYILLINNDEIYKQAVESFLNENGIKSTNHYLQIRLPYLFITFCRNTKSELEKNAEIIFSALSSLLYIPTNTIDDNIIQYYEVIGILLSGKSINESNLIKLYELVLTPVITAVSSIINVNHNNNNNNVKYNENSPQYIILYNALTIISNIFKGFSNNNNNIPLILTNSLIETFKLSYQWIIITNSNNNVVMMSFPPIIYMKYIYIVNKYIDIFFNEIFSFLHEIISQFFTINDYQVVSDVIQLVIKVLASWKKKDKNAILPPVFVNDIMMKRIVEISQFQYVSDSLDSNFQLELKTNYFKLIKFLIEYYPNYITQPNNIVLIPLFIQSIISGFSLPDYTILGLCFSIIRIITPLVITEVDINTGAITPHPTIPIEMQKQYQEFIYSQITSSYFVFIKSHVIDKNVNGNDYLIIKQIAKSISDFITLFKNHYLMYLQQVFFPSINLPNELVQSFIKLFTTQNKLTKEFYLQFVEWCNCFISLN